jgi:Protein of unknown function (DUF1592)/Protein of unknown function (DUF1588)/Protein of unknown function (DUF1595)/Protein of unknown function (DUF1585)
LTGRFFDDIIQPVELANKIRIGEAMRGNLAFQLRPSWQSVLLLLSSVLGACTGIVEQQQGSNQDTNGTSVGPGGVTTTTPGGGAGSTPPGGGAGSTDGPDSTSCDNLAPIQRRLWRLSVEQYQNALKDLLGLPSTPQLTNRGGEAQWAFFSDVSLRVDDSFQYALYQVVESVLPNLPAALTACNSGEAANACATRIATNFGAKAFRRPLSPAEIAALVTSPAQPSSGTTAAVSAAPFLTAGSDTQLGLKLMIEAILLSPSFVYRTELGPSTLSADASGNYPDTKLTPYEVAAQLGFTFLGSVPDAPLEAAAADSSDKGLGSINGIKAQVDRLLALPQVHQKLTAIVAAWFNIGQLFLKTHDTSFLAALPSADQQDQSGIQGDLYTAAQQFISDALWTNSGKVTDLLSSQKGFFNSRLAALYPEVTFANGAPTSLTTFVAGTWPASEARIGLLSDPSYFWAQSDPAANSIVKRGKAIHDDVICADPLPPPVDLSSPAALAVISQGDSEVTKSDARLATAPCNGCHMQMDAYSRVLQHFGPIGNYRTADEVGRSIDTSFTYSQPSPLAPQTIAGPKELAQALESSGHVTGCAVQKMSSYLIGSMIQKYDTCEIATLRQAFAQTDGTLASLFRTVVVADFARTRAGGTK